MSKVKPTFTSGQSVEELLELRNKIDSALVIARIKEKTLPIKVAENIGKTFKDIKDVGTGAPIRSRIIYYKLLKLDCLATKYFVTFVRVEVLEIENLYSFGGRSSST